MSMRYLDINSSYRDRNQFPLTSDFVVRFGNQTLRTGITSSDPISLGIPYQTGLAAGASTTTVIQLSATTSEQTIVNYYVNSWINFPVAGVPTTQYCQITSSTPTAVTVTVPLGFSPAINDVYYISRAKPGYQGTLPTPVNTTTNILLTAAAIASAPAVGGFIGYTFTITSGALSGASSTVTAVDTYANTITVLTAFASAPVAGVTSTLTKTGATTVSSTLPAVANTTSVVYLPSGSGAAAGSYIRIVAGPLAYNYIMIKSFNSAGLYATLVSPFASAPGTVAFELSAFTRDNETPLTANQGIFPSIPVCYNIQLMNVEIPNKTLTVGWGGKISNYPYVYVSLYGDTATTTNQVIFSNNPNAVKAIFRVAVDYSVSSTDPFIILACDEIQTVKFSIMESLRFRVTLPTGEPLAFNISERLSPLEPNPVIQISACFSLKPV